MVGLFIVACVVFFAVSGFFQGLVRQIIGIAALLMAFLFAEHAGALIPDALVQRMNVPLTLIPGVKLGMGGIIVLFAAILVGRFGVKLLRLGKSKEEAAKQKRQDHFRGAMFGGLKGMLFALIVLMIVFSLGQVAEVVEPRARAAAQGQAGPGAPGPKSQPVEGSAVRRFFATAKRRIEKSVAGPVVRRASVLDQEMLQSFGDVIDISNDPQALARLREHPDVQKLMEFQNIRELTRDPEIVQAAQERRLLDLLNHPGVAAAARDVKLTETVKSMDFDRIIAHAKGEANSGKGDGGTTATAE